MNFTNWWRFFLFGTVVDIVLLDQLSKWALTEIVIAGHIGEKSVGLLQWIMSAPEKLPPVHIEILPFFNIVMVWNQGVSFGLFNHDSVWGPVVFIILSGLIAALFGLWLARTQSWMQGIGIAFVLGGALGNIIDRARFGAVIDFLDFHIGKLHWPAFNLADSAIVTGVFLIILHGFIFDKPDKTLSKS